MLLPELPFWRRVAFFAAVLLIAWGFNKLHTHFIPNALIYLTPKQPSAIQKAGPQLLSWLIAASAALAAAVVYGFLKGGAKFRSQAGCRKLSENFSRRLAGLARGFHRLHQHRGFGRRQRALRADADIGGGLAVDRGLAMRRR